MGQRTLTALVAIVIVAIVGWTAYGFVAEAGPQVDEAAGLAYFAEMEGTERAPSTTTDPAERARDERTLLVARLARIDATTPPAGLERFHALTREADVALLEVYNLKIAELERGGTGLYTLAPAQKAEARRHIAAAKAANTAAEVELERAVG